MNIAGPNLYKVVYKFNSDKLKDQEFQKFVVAYSDKEASAIVGDGVVKVNLVDNDISLAIPDQYIKPQGRQL